MSTPKANATDLTREALGRTLAETGQLAISGEAVLTDLTLAAWLGMSPDGVMRQVFHPSLSEGLPYRRVGSRKLTTAKLLVEWVEAGAEVHGKNPKQVAKCARGKR